jgi:hypothetical protein
MVAERDKLSVNNGRPVSSVQRSAHDRPIGFRRQRGFPLGWFPASIVLAFLTDYAPIHAA